MVVPSSTGREQNSRGILPGLSSREEGSDLVAPGPIVSPVRGDVDRPPCGKPTPNLRTLVLLGVLRTLLGRKRRLGREDGGIVPGPEPHSRLGRSEETRHHGITGPFCKGKRWKKETHTRQKRSKRKQFPFYHPFVKTYKRDKRIPSPVPRENTARGREEGRNIGEPPGLVLPSSAQSEGNTIGKWAEF